MSSKTSIEVQDITVIGVLRDPMLLDLVKHDIKDEFFSNPIARQVYNSVVQFHTMYSKTPTSKELATYIQQHPYIKDEDRFEVASHASYLYNTEQYDDKFIRDTITSFISNARMETILSEAIDQFTKRGQIDMNKLADMIEDARGYEILDSDAMVLSDYDAYLENKIKYHGSVTNPRVIKSFIPSVNYSLTAGGYIPGDLVAVVAAPGTGKSNYLVNEAVNCAKQGYHVLSMYFGDMNEVSSANRLMANVTGMPINAFYDNPETYKEVVNNPAYAATAILDKIHVVSFPPGEISVDKVTATVKKYQQKYGVHYDMIIIDYADNLEPEAHSSYDSAGTIYNKLKALGKNNLSTVLTASQPKLPYFKEEIIPFEGLAESSKKQHVLDVCITFGKPSRDAEIGSLFLAKVREGETGGIVRVGLNNRSSTIKQINEEEYRKLRYNITEDPEELTEGGES